MVILVPILTLRRSKMYIFMLPIDFKVGGLSFAEIVVISVAAIFIPLLLLMSLWTMGLVGDKALRGNIVT